MEGGVVLPNAVDNGGIVAGNCMSLESTNIWEKQPFESSNDFTRFECFRLATNRSILKAYVAYIALTQGQGEIDRRRSLGKGTALMGYPANWRKMAITNQWDRRAAAFDAHQHDLDMQVETAERDACRQLRKSALHDLLTASTKALAQIDLSEANLAQASTAIKTAVRELRTEYHDDASTQVEVSAMLAIIPDNIRQGILAMLSVKATTTLPLPDDDNIIDNDDT